MFRSWLFVLFVIVLFGALSFGVIADEIGPVPDDPVEVAEPVDLLPVAEADNALYYIIGIVVVMVAGMGLGADTFKTKSLVAGYDMLLSRLTIDPQMEASLIEGYGRLPGEVQQAFDFPLDLVILLSKMTPTERDDHLGDLIARIRGRPVNE